MSRSFLQYKSSLIAYSTAGNGPALLFCLHGYGSSGQSFLFLESAIEKDFTIYAIDLPFHGATVWKEERFDAEDMASIIRQLSSNTGPDKKIILVGFSLGARIAMSAFPLLSRSTSKLVLIAPDGLTRNRMQQFLTTTRWGRNLFRYALSKPQVANRMLLVLNKLALLSNNRFQFFKYHIDTEEKRAQLLMRWELMRSLVPDIDNIVECVKRENVSVKLIYGEFDHIMPAKQGHRFLDRLGGTHVMKVLPCGHQVLNEKNVTAILDVLNG